MSGNNGMQGGMQMPNSPMQSQLGMMPPAVPNAQQGGMMPVGMSQNPYQYGAPQTANYVQQQAQQRLPNQ